LDNSIVTGLGELTSVASGDQTIVYDASSGTLKKISQSNFLNTPAISSVSPTSVVSGDGTGNYTFTITGSGFTGTSASLVNTSGTTINFDTFTVDSDTQITGVIAKSSLPGSGEPYDIKVVGTNNIAATLEDQINIDAAPTYNTDSGSIGTVVDGARTTASFDIEAFDPESAGNVTFEIQSGSLPAGATTSTVNENGVSKFRIAGTFSAVGSNTTSNFVLRAVDAASNTSSRSFSITVVPPQSESFTSSGTFSVPNGLSSADVLVVAGGGGGSGDNGGGGGAGGLIFFPSYPVTPSGTVTVTVGCGGNGTNGCGQTGQDSVFGSPSDPGLGQGGVLTAKGGGGSNAQNVPIAFDGGSGGGPNGHQSNQTGATGIQPTQPGNSGAYGFGNPGGSSSPSVRRGGGGGGAGAVGASASMCGPGGAGGVGKSYTIADGTTPVAYAGGGGGATNSACQPGPGSPCGTGGAGRSSGPGPYQGVPGTANRGGGGGGGMNSTPRCGGQGGKGIVIVRY
jgi:hypothetical protein